jgi:hypothetical protein
VQPVARDQLPLDKLKLPHGFRIEVYASGIANARSLRVGKRGTVFVGSARTDKVHAISDDDGRRHVKVLVPGVHRTGSHLRRSRRQALYCGRLALQQLRAA